MIIQVRILMCGKVTHMNLIDSSLLFRSIKYHKIAVRLTNASAFYIIVEKGTKGRRWI